MNPRVRAGAAAAALTDDIQEEGAATDTGLLSICPECSRAFGSGRGLSQHRRRAHPSEYHAENVPVARMKARWDHEELLILARTENVFRRSGVRNINQRLVQITPGRTLDSIKGVRKSKRYQELLASLQREADSSELMERIPASDPGAPNVIPDLPTQGEHPVPNVDWAVEVRDAIWQLGVPDGIDLDAIVPGLPTPLAGQDTARPPSRATRAPRVRTGLPSCNARATIHKIKEALCSHRPFRYLGGGAFPSTDGFTGAILAWRIPATIDHRSSHTSTERAKAVVPSCPHYCGGRY